MDVLPETPEGRVRAEKKAQAGDRRSRSRSRAVEAERRRSTTKRPKRRASLEARDDDPYGYDPHRHREGLRQAHAGPRVSPARPRRAGRVEHQITEKNGKVAGAAHVYAGDQLLLITEQGMMIRVAVDGIRSMGRNTQGVRVINIDEDDTVVAAVKVVDRSETAAKTTTSGDRRAKMTARRSRTRRRRRTDEEPVH